jgi:hypothetical protein
MEVDDDDMDIDDSRVVRVVGLSRKVLRELSSESEECKLFNSKALFFFFFFFSFSFLDLLG